MAYIIPQKNPILERNEDDGVILCFSGHICITEGKWDSGEKKKELTDQIHPCTVQHYELGAMLLSTLGRISILLRILYTTPHWVIIFFFLGEMLLVHIENSSVCNS